MMAWKILWVYSGLEVTLTADAPYRMYRLVPEELERSAYAVFDAAVKNWGTRIHLIDPDGIVREERG